jgi:membrane associated rhomboid family serine protease
MSANNDQTPSPEKPVLRSPVPVRPHWTRRRLVIVPTIVALNIVVYLAWQAAATGSELHTVLYGHFLASTDRLQLGRWWTLITAGFSHMDLWHISLNLIVLWSFGSILERVWRVRVFSVCYLTAVVAASLSHCLVASLILHDDTIAVLGASGAVSALLMAFALLTPKEKILLFGLIPVAALPAVLFFVALDIWGLIVQSRGLPLPIGHGAHLGGSLCGAVLWAVYLRKRSPRLDSPSGLDSRPTVEMTRDEAIEFDHLRDKLAREGPSALTPEERSFMLDIRERALSEPQDS